ncbi:hypothetical protein GCM10023238_26360 [Streptomyces heliomycini]
MLAALDVLGYERPVRLRQRSEGLVGLITPELENPIFPALAQVIGQALTRQGYTPVLATQTPGGSTEDELTEMLVDRGVAGIIYVSGLHADTTADMQRYERLRAQGVPFVLVDGFSPKVQAPFISPDDRAAMALAVTHLASLGHTRIGLALGPKRFVPVQRKIEGFVRAVQEQLGLSAETVETELVQHSLYTLEGGQAAASALMDRDCTAVVCASDMMALGAIRAARQRGLDVPKDISVVGFDDSPLIALHRPAADHGPQAGPGDGPGPRCAPCWRRSAERPRRTASSCSCRNWWCAVRPLRPPGTGIVPRAEGRTSGALPRQEGADPPPEEEVRAGTDRRMIRGEGLFWQTSDPWVTRR